MLHSRVTFTLILVVKLNSLLLKHCSPIQSLLEPDSKGQENQLPEIWVGKWIQMWWLGSSILVRAGSWSSIEMIKGLVIYAIALIIENKSQICCCLSIWLCRSLAFQKAPNQVRDLIPYKINVCNLFSCLLSVPIPSCLPLKLLLGSKSCNAVKETVEGVCSHW